MTQKKNIAPSKRLKERRVGYIARPRSKSRSPNQLPFPQARHLTHKERVALEAYKNYLLEKLPNEIERIILFGSKARGDSRSWSDVDLLVVVCGVKPKTAWGLDERRWFTIVDCTFDFLMQYGVYIAPTVLHVKEMKLGLPLLNDIRKDGIELWHQNAIKKPS